MMHHDLAQVRETMMFENEELTGDLSNLLSTSPVPPYFKYSSSLEPRKMPIMAAAMDMNKAPLADRQSPSTMKIIAFAKSDSPCSFVFVKEKVQKQIQQSSFMSGLAMSMLDNPKTPKSKAISGSKMDISVPALHLVVFVMINAGPLPNKITVKIVPSATVEQLIDVVVRQLNQLLERARSDDASITPINSKSCQLMLCEEDGRPDTDTPVLQRDAEIHRFNCTVFALCRDPDYNISSEARPVFKVVLPSKEYQVLSLNPGMTLRHVMEKVCRKRLMDPYVYYMVSGKEPHQELDLDKCIDELDTMEVVIRSKARKYTLGIPPFKPRHPRSPSKGDLADLLPNNNVSAPPVVNEKLTRQLGLPQQFFFTAATVAQHVQYPVIKVNKYGKKQERIMGIDRERITNCLPPNVKSGKIHTPFRLINTIKSAYVLDRAQALPPGIGLGTHSNQRKPFCIDFNDGICVYESEKADEIVSRITFIISNDMGRRLSH